MEAEVREERCYAAGFEDGGRGYEPRKTSSLWKLEKAKKWITP